jgi:hypothetical protein
MRRPVLAVLSSLLVLAVLTPARPAFASAPDGALLSPSNADANGPGTFLSDKDDGTDTLYHFNVRAIGTGGAGVAFVRVQIKPFHAVTFVTVGNATQVGTTDTWELKWNQTESGITEGQNGQVRALIQDSNGETAFVPSEAGQLVHFDNSAPTAEITNPADGGTLGFVNGTATMHGTASGDVDEIDGFYTKSGPTGVQTWVSCGSSNISPNPAGTSEWDVDCGLASGDQPAQVQAVAVVPISDIPILRTQGAGDAHRVSTTALQPNSVVISPAGPAQTTSHCQVFTLQVLDNNGANLSGKNVDLHVNGPGNNVYFASGAKGEDGFTSPDFPTSHGSFEVTDACDKNNAAAGGGSGTPTGPAQPNAEGEDGGSPTTKHIEGTTTAHGFTFAVSSHSAGSSTIQGWYDVTDNDANDNPSQMCPASGATVEPCGTTTATWDAPVATSVAVSPAQEQADLGKTRKATATVIDQHGNPLAGATVSFEVTAGPNSTQDVDSNGATPPGYYGFCQTVADGTCSRTYTDVAKENGIDTLNAFIDVNGDLTPESGEPQATAQQTWGTGPPPPPPTGTSLTIRPTSTQHIPKGHRIRFRGELSSTDQACVENQSIVLLNGKGVVNRYTVPAGSSQQDASGTWISPYLFQKRPTRTQFYHVEYRGTSSCGASRAPATGSVKVVVRKPR